ncbi:hypothetical protein AAVH_24850 [Aphelenchoides avenae]|nr:hypothetical protein AAVH_24850 [Aphelenchus avenae]
MRFASITCFAIFAALLCLGHAASLAKQKGSGTALTADAASHLEKREAKQKGSGTALQDEWNVNVEKREALAKQKGSGTALAEDQKVVVVKRDTHDMKSLDYVLDMTLEHERLRGKLLREKAEAMSALHPDDDKALGN